MIEYLKIIYLKDESKVISKITEKELFDYLNEQGLRPELERDSVVIFRIGECIIDWSF